MYISTIQNLLLYLYLFIVAFARSSPVTLSLMIAALSSQRYADTNGIQRQRGEHTSQLLSPHVRSLHWYADTDKMQRQRGELTFH